MRNTIHYLIFNWFIKQQQMHHFLSLYFTSFLFLDSIFYFVLSVVASLLSSSASSSPSIYYFFSAINLYSLLISLFHTDCCVSVQRDGSTRYPLLYAYVRYQFWGGPFLRQNPDMIIEILENNINMKINTAIIIR